MTAFLVTRSASRVEHLAVWAYDRDLGESWSTGRYVPLCASERHHGLWHPVESVHAELTSNAAPVRRRLCKRCRRELNQILTLALAALARFDDDVELPDLLTEDTP